MVIQTVSWDELTSQCKMKLAREGKLLGVLNHKCICIVRFFLSNSTQFFSLD